MAAKGSLSFIELHVEKGILGLSALFALGMAGFYLMGPNTVEYKGQKLGPDELDEAIASQAERLDRTISTATATVAPVPKYSEELRQRFSAGIFGAPAEAPESAIPRELQVATRFGNPIPVLSDKETDSKDIALASVLPPSKPVTRTGISLVYREQAMLEGPLPVGQTADEPVERSWVSVAGWYPRAAQQRAMIAAQYAGYRAQVYVAGVDVERQVMLADGGFSEWEPVQASKATVKIDPPEPVFDEHTGKVLNQAQLDQALEQTKNHQKLLMQPFFYAVDAGDFWDPPPLPGYSVEAPEGGGQDAPAPEPYGRDRPTGPTVRPPPPGGGGMPPAGGGYMGPGGGRPPVGGPPVRGTSAGQANREAREQLQQKLSEAKTALRNKDWNLALQTAREILNSSAATRAQRNEAEKIRKRALLGLEKEKRAGDRRPMGPVELVVNPEGEDHDPAVWVHDDSVEPGKTYRYRMRVKLWNRYVGKRENLADPAQAGETVLTGSWSLASDPVVVAPKSHFFVQGTEYGAPAARVEVFTWHRGDWYKERFAARVGSVIGDVKEIKIEEWDDDGEQLREKIDFTTGAVVLDLQLEEPVLTRRSMGDGGFIYDTYPAVVVTYLDPVDGQVKTRIDLQDRSDPLYKELKEETEE